MSEKDALQMFMVQALARKGGRFMRLKSNTSQSAGQPTCVAVGMAELLTCW